MKGGKLEVRHDVEREEDAAEERDKNGPEGDLLS
jgi:hypothetical protein